MKKKGKMVAKSVIYNEETAKIIKIEKLNAHIAHNEKIPALCIQIESKTSPLACEISVPVAQLLTALREKGLY